MLSINQRLEERKLEIVIPICSSVGTACVSLNYHQDHFASRFGIRTASGALAHSACIGFGMERIALALFKKHGLDPASWPPSVRATLARADRARALTPCG
jgi:seryl-tRNA synthetase